MRKIIRIGTRGSVLSLTQTNSIKDLLHLLIPDIPIEIVTIKTSGDKNMAPIPLDTIGKGWFTKEIDRKLLDGEIDLAVHSLKDLLDTLTPGLVITAIPERVDPSEALLSRSNLPLKQLPKGAVIGTDSVRRKMQLLKLRPDLIVKSVRGNVNRRLDKLDAGEYDALVLAVAGLIRLGLEKRITQYFSPSKFIPSPGQGALAVVSNKSNKKLNALLSKLNNQPSLITITAEREFSRRTNGGCSMPVGAYAVISGKKLTLYGMIGSEDEKHMIKGFMTGRVDDPKGLGGKLAEKLLEQTSSWTNTQNNSSRYVVLTRDVSGNKIFAEKLESLGTPTLSCPSIAITDNLNSRHIKQVFSAIQTYDWILFTSSNGVRFFIKGMKRFGMHISELQSIRIAAVGEKTAGVAQNSGLNVSLIPKTFTGKDLIESLSDVKGKTILLPRSNIADQNLTKTLEKKGAIVTELPIYQTELNRKINSEFTRLVKQNAIRCITFTSPSTVKGFLKNVVQSDLQDVVSLPVLSIGPVTTNAAKEQGFTTVVTADIHTINGMIDKLQQNIL